MMTEFERKQRALIISHIDTEMRKGINEILDEMIADNSSQEAIDDFRKNAEIGIAAQIARMLPDCNFHWPMDCEAS